MAAEAGISESASSLLHAGAFVGYCCWLLVRRHFVSDALCMATTWRLMLHMHMRPRSLYSALMLQHNQRQLGSIQGQGTGHPISVSGQLSGKLVSPSHAAMMWVLILQTYMSGSVGNLHPGFLPLINHHSQISDYVAINSYALDGNADLVERINMVSCLPAVHARQHLCMLYLWSTDCYQEPSDHTACQLDIPSYLCQACPCCH